MFNEALMIGRASLGREHPKNAQPLPAKNNAKDHHLGATQSLLEKAAHGSSPR
jgi:hypothetical protein